MASLFRFSISIMACLVLTTTAKSDMIIPVPSTTTTTTSSTSAEPSLDTPLSILAAIPAISGSSSTGIKPSSTTNASEPSPTPVSGDDTFILLGCFNEPPLNSSTRALGASGTYFSPRLDPQNVFTVPLCLKACGAALAPNSNGPYIYAGVENIRECFCGLTLSALSKKVDNGYCASQCLTDAATICGGYGYLTLYQRRSSLELTGTTFNSMPPPTSSPVLVTSPSKSKSSHSSGFWIGISLGIIFFLVLVLALVFYLRHRQAARRTKALANAGLSTDTSFLGGFALMHPPQKLQRSPVNTVYTEDGRRFGIVVVDGATDIGTYVSPVDGCTSPEIRNRPTFDEWKSGMVSPARTLVAAPTPAPSAPARVPINPSAVNYSVELDSVASPGGHLDAGAVQVDGEHKAAYHTPVAELADSRIPVSVESKERGSVDSDTVKDTRPKLDERELERRLKDLGGLSPVSEASGLETWIH